MTTKPLEHHHFQTILVPVDGSPQADSALTLAFGVAKKYDARILVCNAQGTRPVDSGELAVLGYPDAVTTDQMRKASEEVVASAIAFAHKHGVNRIEGFVSESNPIQAIPTNSG